MWDHLKNLTLTWFIKPMLFVFTAVGATSLLFGLGAVTAFGKEKRPAVVKQKSSSASSKQKSSRGPANSSTKGSGKSSSGVQTAAPVSGSGGGSSYGGALESSGSGKATEVKGQIRNLSMMLVLKNQKDRIEFVRMRRDYRKEILDTKY
jgi:hypothetical protein